MNKKIYKIKTINLNFYRLIKDLRRNKLHRSAKIAKYAYEEFFQELSEMFKTHIS